MNGNPWAGQVCLTINGSTQVMKLTLGALAELEEELESGSLIDLVTRFESGEFSARDLLLLLCAGLRGGGADFSLEDVADADIEGGPLTAAQAAGRLLALAFGPAGHGAA